MVSIVGGSELGVNTNSGKLLGGRGELGEAGQGRSGEGVTVNAVTGNLVIQRQDEYVAGKGLDIAMLRTYNSQAEFDGDYNGDLWQIGYTRRLANMWAGPNGLMNEAGAVVVRVAEDGTVEVYEYDAGRNAFVYKKSEGAHDTITLNSWTAPTEYTWTDGATGNVEIYDDGGALTKITDPDGNFLTLAYNADWLLEYVTDFNGDKTQLIYDTATGKTRNLLEIRTLDSSGNRLLTRVRYTYDGENRLASVVVDLTPSDHVASAGAGQTYSTIYSYVAPGSKRISSIQQTDGSRLDITYDVDGRVKTYADWRSSGDIRTTTFTYDTVNRTTKVVSVLGQSPYTANFETVLSYNEAGQVISIRSPQVTGTAGSYITTSFTYVGDQVATVTDGRGAVTTYEYDTQGNRILERDAVGNTVKRYYDSYNRLRMEKAFTGPDPDQGGAGQPTGERTTHYVYEGASARLRFVITPEGRVTEYRYNATTKQRIMEFVYVGDLKPAGDVLLADNYAATTPMTSWVVTSSPRTERRDFTYDARGQLATVKSWGAISGFGNGSTGTDTTVQYVYNPAGQLIGTVDGRGLGETFEYDGLGRRTLWVDRVGQSTHYLYDDANNKTAITWDASGLTITTQYDAAGRVVSEVRSDNLGNANSANLATTTYTYDKLGRRLTETNADRDARPSILYAYDGLGRKVQEVDTLGNTTEYVYNGANQVIRKIRYTTPLTLGQMTAFNALPRRDPLRPALTPTDRTDYYVYDAAGRLVKTVDATGAVVDYVYDGRGLLLQKTQRATVLTTTQRTTLKGIAGEVSPTDAAVVVADTADDRVTRYFYDLDGRQVATLDGEGYLTETVYDAGGRVTKQVRYATVTLAANRASGTLAQLKTDATTVANANDQWTYWLYNARGQVSAMVDAERYVTEYRYDDAGNKNGEIRYYNALASYTYNATQALTAQGLTVSAEDRVAFFLYDGENRLNYSYHYTGAWRADVVGTSYADGYSVYYVRDGLGNVVGKAEAAGSLVALFAAPQSERAEYYKDYDSQGRVIAEMSPAGAALLAAGVIPEANLKTYYTYDAMGRMTSKTEPVDATGRKARTVYYYDKAGRLTHIVNALGEVTQSSYDAFGGVTTVTRYGTRITNATTLAGLTGGITVSSDAFSTLVTSLANATVDSTEKFSYDARGAKISHTDAKNIVDATATYNAFGEQSSSTLNVDATRTRVQSYTYDRRGLLATDTLAGAVTSVQRDAFGRVTQTTDARGSIWLQTYDRLGRVVTTKAPVDTFAGVMTYDAFGQVLTQQDALGYTTTYSYNTAARTMTVSTPEGVNTTTTRNAFGQVISIKDGRNNVTNYTYNLDGQLLSTTAPIGTGAATASTTHAYDAAGNLLSSTFSSTLDSSSVKTVFTYDAVGRVLTRTVDPSTTSPSYTGLNLTTRTLYDAKGEAVWTQDASGIWTETQYDLKGQVTAVIVDPLQQPAPNADGTFALGAAVNSRLNLRTEYTYDNRGKTLTVTEGVGSANPKVTEYEYDVKGRRVAERVDPNGLRLETSYVYDANDNVVARVDANLKVTRYIYNPKNQLIYTVDPTGAVVKMIYDAGGRVISSTAFADRISLTGLTSEIQIATLISTGTTPPGRLVQANPAYASNPSNQLTRAAYDRDGRLRFSIDGLNYVTEREYDAAGNVIRTTRYENAMAGTLGLGETPVVIAIGATAPTSGAYIRRSDLDRITQSDYDKANRLIAVTDGLGYVTRSIYDGAGRLTYRVDATGAVVKYQYDAAGRVLQATAYANRVSLAGLGATPTASAVTAALTAANAGYATNASNQVTRSVYDKNGRVRFSIDSLNYVTENQYDAAGHLIRTTRYNNPLQRTLAAGDAPPIVAIGQGVPGSGPYVQASAADQTTYRVYDAAGRTLWTVDAEGYGTQFVYDAAGRATKQTQYLDKIVGSLLNSAGSATVAPKLSPQSSGPTYTVKADDRITRHWYDGTGAERFSIDAEGYLTAYTRDAAGRELTRTRYATAYGAGVADNAALATIQALLPATPAANEPVFQSEYDSFGNLVKAIDGENVATVYVYDAAGRQVEVRYAAGSSEQSITRFSYDAAGRLVEETRADGSSDQATTRYVLDAVGNRVRIIDPRGVELAETDSAWALALRKQLLYLNGSNGAKLASQLTADERRDLLGIYTLYQQFDAQGRVTRSTDPLGVERATTDTQAAREFRRSIGLVDGGGNGLDAVALSAAQREFLLNMNATFTEYDAFGNAVKVTDPSGKVGYFYFDQNNRNVLQLDPAGGVTSTKYTAFGTVERVIRYANKVVVPAGSALSTTTPVAIVTSVPNPATGPYVVEDTGRDQKTVIEHDRRNLQTKVTDGESYYESTTYDAFGNKKTYINKAGGEFTYEYDRKGNVTKEIGPVTLEADGVTTVPGIIKRYAYDQRGNVTKTWEADGLPEMRYTEYVYDRLDRLTEKYGQTFNAYTSGGQSVQLRPAEKRAYDKLGNLIEVRVAKDSNNWALASRTLYYYDANNRRIAQIDPTGAMIVWQYNDGDKPIKELAYANRLTSLPSAAGGQPPQTPSTAGENAVREKRFTYDANNRLIETLLPDVLVGELAAGGQDYIAGIRNITISNVYDAVGNLLVSVDGRGSKTFYLYDALGRKTQQLDPMVKQATGTQWDYAVTTWEYDAAGNIKRTYQYANKVSIDPATIPGTASPGVHGDDRITDFTYDRLGQVKTKTVSNVAYATVGGTGVLSTGSGASITQYSYNGLGFVTQEIDANGATTQYVYDKLGQMLSEKRQSFIDYTGATVYPQTDYSYNGLGQVDMEAERGTNNTTVADDRITLYFYGPDGRLAGQWEPNGASTVYRYDAAGNVTEKTLQGRLKADGTTVDDITRYGYDAAGHQTWSVDVGTGEVREVRYNAFGEVTGKGLHGGGAAAAPGTAVYQEVAFYNVLGKAWLTNSGDGAAKAFLYDANGNATNLLQSASDTVDFTNKTMLEILGIVGNGNQIPTAPNTYQTINQYDARNQLINTYQPKMIDSHSPVGYVGFVSGNSGQTMPGGNVQTVTATQGTTPSNKTGNAALSTFTYDLVYKYDDHMHAMREKSAGIKINLPDISALGGGDIEVTVIRKTNVDPAGTATVYTFTGGPSVGYTIRHVDGSALTGPGSIPDPTASFLEDRLWVSLEYWNWNDSPSVYNLVSSYSVEVVKVTDGGRVSLSKFEDTYATAGGSADNRTLPTAKTATTRTMILSGQPFSADSANDDLVIQYRRSSTNDTWLSLKAFKANINTYVFNPGALNLDTFEFRYTVLDQAGNILNSEKGTYSTGFNTISQQLAPYGGSGYVFMQGDVLNFTQMNLSADKLKILYRVAGTTTWLSSLTTNINADTSYSNRGWFVLDISSTGLNLVSGQAYDYIVEARSGSSVLSTAMGSFTRGSPNLVTQPVAQVIRFPAEKSNAPVANDNAYRMVIDWTNITTGATGTKTVYKTNGEFTWDLAGNAVPNASQNYRIDFTYKTYDNNGTGNLINQATVTNMILGSTPSNASSTYTAAVIPTVLSFKAPQVEGVTMQLFYRTLGSTGSYKSANVTRTYKATNPDPFKWTVADATVTNGSNLEYYYYLLDGNGQQLKTPLNEVIKVKGTLVVVAPNATPDPAAILLKVYDPVGSEGAVHRQQTYNAFGEIMEQTDGQAFNGVARNLPPNPGHTTKFKYNTLGQLVEKLDPLVSITHANGFQESVNPKTTYYYDLGGRLVGTTDANGNTIREQLVAGTGMDGSGSWVTKTFNPDGGVIETKLDIFGNARELNDGTRQEFDKAGHIIKITRPQREAYTAINGTPVLQSTIETYQYDQAGQRIAHSRSLDGNTYKNYYDVWGNRMTPAVTGSGTLNTEKVEYDSLGRIRKSYSYEGLLTQYDYQYDGNILGIAGKTVGGVRKTTTVVGAPNTMIDDLDYFGHMTWHRDHGGHVFKYQYNAAGWLTKQTSNDSTIAAQNSGQNIENTYYANGYLKSINDLATGSVTYYEYDNDGNRTLEQYTVPFTYTQGGQTFTTTRYLQQAEVTYDGLNRVVRVHDPMSDIYYEYDANNNRRRVLSYYHDGLNGALKTQDYWYTYDQMNRFTVTMGQLLGANGNRGTSKTDTSVSVQRGQTGVFITYDAETSQRRTAQRFDTLLNKVVQERYDYSADGYLAETYIDETTGNGANYVLRATRQNDAYGRTIGYIERNASGTVTQTKENRFNADNLLTGELLWSGVRPANGSNVKSATGYYYSAADTGVYSGILNATSTVNAPSVVEQIMAALFDRPTSGSTIITYTYQYTWWDEAKQSDIGVEGQNKKVVNWKPGLSHFTYDVNGHIKQVDDSASTIKRTLRYTTNAQGLILTRKEAQGTGQQVNIDGSVGPAVLTEPVGRYHTYYYLNGHRIGDVGSDGAAPVSYAEELALQQTKVGQQKDRANKWQLISSADFDQNYIPINSRYPAAAASSYTVQFTGETLRSVAAAVWGDAAMWYLIADANGLSGDEALVVDQVLTIPNKVTNIHNNSNTFKVYDPGDVMGDTMPTLPAPPPPPKPKKKKSCGGIGGVLVAVVAVVVTVFTAGAALAVMVPQIAAAIGATGLGLGATAMAGGMAALGVGAVGLGAMGIMAGPALAMAAGAIGAAVGSVVSQGVGIATGAQDSFSWSQVGMAAIGGAISASPVAGMVSNTVHASGAAAAMVRAAVGSTMTQGVAVATGMQEKFSWTQVAVSAVGAGVGEKVGGWAGSAAKSAGLGDSAQKFFGNLGGSLAAGGASAVISGERPNWGMIAVDSFGNALGSLAMEKIVEADRKLTVSTVMKTLNATPENNPATADYVQRMAAQGARTDLILQDITGNKALQGALADLNEAHFGRNEGQIIQASESYLQSVVDGQAIAPVPTQTTPATATTPEEAIVTARKLPGEDTVFTKTLTGGVQLADSLIDFEAKYGRAAGFSYRAITGMLSGGPIKGVVTSLAKYAVSSAADQAIDTVANTTSTAVEGFVTKWATDSHLDMSLTLGGTDYAITPDQIGFAAGQLAGTVVEAGLNKGLDSAVMRAKTVREQVGAYRGGPHTETRLPVNDGLDSHHMPDRNADSRVVANSGPAIQMDPADHVETSSNGRKGLKSVIYRAETAEMIEQGRYRDAMAREIWDVRNAAAKASGDRTKYNEAMQEMLDYARSSDQLPVNPRTGR